MRAVSAEPVTATAHPSRAGAPGSSHRRRVTRVERCSSRCNEADPGSSSQSTGQAYLTLARCLEAQGRDTEKGAPWRNMPRISWKKSIGSDHPDTRSARELASGAPDRASSRVRSLADLLRNAPTQFSTLQLRTNSLCKRQQIIKVGANHYVEDIQVEFAVLMNRKVPKTHYFFLAAPPTQAQ